MTQRYYLQVKRLGTHEPLASLFGPSTIRKAERQTRGLLINMNEDSYVDEWPEEDGPNGGNQPEKSK